MHFIEAEQALESGLLPPAGTAKADPTQANKTTTVPNVTRNLILITEGLALSGIAEEKPNREMDCTLVWWKWNKGKLWTKLEWQSHV